MEELVLLMKGGKDMKRIYNFEENDETYVIFLEETEVYTINKDNLKVDGTKFYETFFSEYSIGDSIELKKGNSVKNSNKLSIAVYDTISKLLNEIIQKIDEEKED